MRLYLGIYSQIDSLSNYFFFSEILILLLVNCFKELFNSCSLKGIRCLETYATDKKVKIASDITSAIYEISGINHFDVNDILSAESFTVYDKRAEEEKEVKDKIKNLYFDGAKLYAELAFGNVMLRTDYFIEKLVSLYGGVHPVAVKKDVKFLNGLTTEEYLKSL